METFIKLKFSVLLLSFVLLCNNVYTQTDTNFLSTGLRLIAKSNSSTGILYIKDSVQLPPTIFITSYGSQIGLGSLDNLVQYSSKNDGAYTHNRYQQYHNGVQVENGQYIIHCKDGYARYANGKIVRQLNIITTPVITDSLALQITLNYIGANVYGWQVYNHDSTLFSAHPTPQLLITKLDSVVPIYKLAYKLSVTSLDSTINSTIIYIDAITGSIIKKRNALQSNTCNCCNGKAQTIYNGQQAITTHERGFPNNDFVLKDECRGDGIESVFFKEKIIGKGFTTKQIDDGDNNWSAPEEQASTSALWAFENIFDYYSTIFGRNSFDDQGTKIEIIAKKTAETNAGWIPDLNKFIIFQGVDQFSKSLVSLDVLGHEFTHGVIQHSSLLDGISGESGALNESFADIMGEMIEFSITPNVSFYEKGSEFLLSTDINAINKFRRSFINPNLYLDASTYEGNYWVDPTDLTNDAGGIHQNSGVQNKWFYLLAEGGSGVNDKGQSYCVQGIGKTKATRIVYQNMVHNVTFDSDFLAARVGAILAAELLFGSNSNEVMQTTAAWYAVGVGAQYSGQFDLSGLFVSPYSAHYNSKIRAQGLTVIGGDLDISSNTEIEILSGVDIYAGSNAAFYIAPACAGGARLANPNASNNSNETLQEETTEYTAVPVQKTIELAPIRAYPNPTTGTLNVIAPQAISTLTITTIMGQVVTQLYNINSATTTINTQQLINGTYLLKIQFNDSSTSVTKFTKE